MNRLGALEVYDLEQKRDALIMEINSQTARLEQERTEHSAGLQSLVLQAEREIGETWRVAREQQSGLHHEIAEMQKHLVVTEDTALLQEAGIYEYRHPLDDAVAYQAELARLKDTIRAMARSDGGAVRAMTGFSLNGSDVEGRAMVRDVSKLLLRAYNAEADNLVRGLKPYKLDSAIDRLGKVAIAISKLGRMMDISISGEYHNVRVTELQLTADYLEMVAQQKEREREARVKLREEQKAQQELARERARLEKEKSHYSNALQSLLEKGDDEGAARLRARMAEVDAAIDAVDYRTANVRAGYVYVISNIGAFGDHVVKVGMTRRLEPMDRVRELGDASVPFKFDVHALFFAEDAVGIEAQMHERFADRRVNRVNLRREFFYATPHEAKECLLELSGDLLQFEETPEALEYRQSRNEHEGYMTA